MVIRKRYRRPRVYRRRRVCRRRIQRPIKGSGFTGERFFKIREVQKLSSAPTQDKYYNIFDNPNTAQNWNDLVDLFDSYRCCAIKVKYVPYMNVNQIVVQNRAYNTEQSIQYRTEHTVQNRAYNTERSIQYRTEHTIQNRAYSTEQTIQCRTEHTIQNRAYDTEQSIQYRTEHTVQNRA